jgi:hypothetical protein
MIDLRDGTHLVPLTKDYLALVSSDDAGLVGQYNWCADVRRRPDGTVGIVYAQARVDGANIHLHRFLAGGDAGDVDHRNGDGLDNRRRNLRRATHIQNTRNCRKRAACSSKYKGVSRTRVGTWAAYINVNRERRHLGCFGSEDAAALAYDAAALKFFGDFALLNFPAVEAADV